MPTLAAPLDFAKLEGRNIRIHVLSTAPSSPVTGQMYYNSTDNTLYWWDGTAWIAAEGGAPGGPAGGDLSGTYPNPQIATGVIVLADCNASMADQPIATASLRTLTIGGAGANVKGMPGDARLDLIASANLTTSPVSLNSQKIVSLGAPTNANDAATKDYVDGVAQGLDVRASCRVASTGNINIASPGATIDGVTMAATNRVLLKDQSTGSQNGIYVWNGAAVAMSRALDADISAEVTPGMFTFIEEGTVNADSGWTLTTNAPITLDTTALVFSQFSGAGTVVAGAGMTKTGNTLDVGGTANRITVAADTVDIAATYAGQTSITTLGTITTGVWTGTNIAIANGGTAGTTPNSARVNLAAAGYYTSATHGAGTTIGPITAATHGLRPNRGLIVQCQIDATGEIILPDVIVSIAGDVTITFAVSQSANTIRVTILG